MLATLPSQLPSLRRRDVSSTNQRSTASAPSSRWPSRLGASRSTAAVRFWSRNGNEKTAQFPDIVAAIAAWLKKLKAPVVLDGEIVALDEEMRPAGFQRLQHRIHVTVPGFNSKKQILPPDEQPAAFVVFDLLRDGEDDLRDLSLTERAQAPRSVVQETSRRRIRRWCASPRNRSATERAAKQANAENWEGLMVKLARSPYRTAKRSPEWMKYKLNKQDEFVVCGWTDPGGTRAHFGSLILGAHDADGAAYAGDVGTGFKGAELDRVMKLLRTRDADVPVQSRSRRPVGERRRIGCGRTSSRRFAIPR